MIQPLDYRSMISAAADEKALFRLVFNIFHVHQDQRFVGAGSLAGWRIAEITDQLLPAAFRDVLRKRIDTALNNLQRGQLVARDRDDDICLTEKGFLEGQDLFLPDRSEGAHELPQNARAIPAADRFVTLHDNQPEVQAARSAVNELVERVEGANDLFANDEDRLVAIREVRSLREALAAPRQRFGALWQAAQESSVISFIAREAAGGVVGDVAMKALAALAALVAIFG
ncbi:MAG: hypothetical protein O9272_00265 [Brevundimonas sp.]|nr:hypothetical protein [Brevundimonas sp.]